MDRTSIRVVTILVILIFPMAKTIQENTKLSLVAFMNNLSSGTAPSHPNWGWNTSSDPCIDKWIGVNCTDSQQVRKIVLEGLGFKGTLDAASICATTSLRVLSLKDNKIFGFTPKQIGNCKRLTHFFFSGNRFSGSIAGSISEMINLKRLNISNNSFSGRLPDMSRISGLLSFLAQDNQLSGPIPNLDFVKIVRFKVSKNNFVCPIPDVEGKFNADSFLGNSGLCGKPLQNICPPSPQPKSKRSLKDKIIMYSGYSLLVLVVLLYFVHDFGVIPLELSTGKLIQNNTNDLATWVQSVVSEEWTAEVLDNSLISESVNEERKIKLLQLALSCINPSPNQRPNMNQILTTIHKIMVDEEPSNISNP